VTVSIAPFWKVPENGPFARLAEVSLSEGDLGYDITGSDLRIGVVRGRRGEGDWGVSFVRRTFEDGSTQGALLTECILEISCYGYGTQYVYQDTTLTGVEANRFIAFGTYRGVVQIGADLAGGVGWYQGTVERREAFNDFSEGSTEPEIRSISTDVSAAELSPIEPSLLGRAELAAAVLLTRALHIRFSGGLNYPGTHVASVSILYFFDAE
jgi:hypothetical protein